MQKRISILTLLLLFLVSTTGMPLIVHYCKIMESVSMQECEMHTLEIKNTSCCQQKDAKALDECCQDILVDHSVKEIYNISKTEFSSLLSLITFLPDHTVINSDFTVCSEIYSSATLIPGNKIYLSNSILLI
jgi:hypothetical protein